jgi:hypothetical protein
MRGNPSATEGRLRVRSRLAEVAAVTAGVPQIADDFAASHQSAALGQEETSLSIGRWRSLATDATLGFQRTINRTITLCGFKPPPWT